MGLRKTIRKLVNRYGFISAEEKAKLKKAEAEFPHIMSLDETVDAMLRGVTLCRYGDAEFDVGAALNSNDPYQRPSERLTQRLKEIIHTPSSDSLLICIPPFNSKHNNKPWFYKGLNFWQWYWMKRWDSLKPMFSQKTYGNSFVSRDAVFYEVPLEKIKKAWEGRDVVFVVSQAGNFIMDERIFDNIKSAEFVYVKPTHAFDEYDRVLEESLRFPKDRLFFIAAGPTATVLAFDLHKQGYQALDMGHMSYCYAEYLGERVRPEEQKKKTA